MLISVWIPLILLKIEKNGENRVIVCQMNNELWVPPFLSYELWKLRIELRKQAIQTASKSQEVTRVSYSSFIEKKISVKSF